MKVVLLLAFVLVGAYAQTVTNWDLSEISPESGIESGKAAFAAPHDKKAHNQGYRARYTQQGKTLKMSLTVQKENEVRVTDTDRLLFGIEGAAPEQEAEMANMTLSYGETASICESALGPAWQTSVHLPQEELTYIEALRLAASLNEYTLLGGAEGEASPAAAHKHTRGQYQGVYDCICHGTKHKFKDNGYGDSYDHSGPYWGIRILGKHKYGLGYPHTNNPYGPGYDCLLCDGNSVGGGTDTESPFDFEYDCRWCCFGKCVVMTGGEDFNGSPYAPYVPWCDFTFRFDGLYDSDGTNFFLLNDVGSCRLPRTYKCEAEVERWCTCETFIDALFDSDTQELIEDCDYCDKVVGGNKYICPNCSYSLAAIEAFGEAGNFTNAGDDGVCDCGNAMWQLAYSTYDKKGSKKGGYNSYGGYDAGYGNSYNAGYGYNDESSYNAGYGYNDESSYNAGYGYNDESSSYSSYSDSYNTGYDASYGQDYNSGYNAGYDASYGQDYSSGYNAGYDASYGQDYSSGYNAGYDASYGQDYSSGYNAGYDASYGQDYSSGYNAGYSAESTYGSGYDASYGSGYNAVPDQTYGYNAGYSADSTYGSGYNAGYSAESSYGSYDASYGASYSNGYDATYSNGYDASYSNSYDASYSAPSYGNTGYGETYAQNTYGDAGYGAGYDDNSYNSYGYGSGYGWDDSYGKDSYGKDSYGKGYGYKK